MLLQLVEPGQTPLPHEDHDDVAIGIDLGTTNSVVTISINRDVIVIGGEDGVLVPSVVDYSNGESIVGYQAFLKQTQTDVIVSIKRLMGRPADEADALVYPLAQESYKGMARLRVGNTLKTPVEVSADILKHLRNRAEKFLGRPVTKAVITVPAYFDEGARQATKDAATLAGLTVLRLINEPTAAALAYGLDRNAEGIYVVYDLGGGTFDVSILNLTKGVFQVLATGGNTHLGGDDIDKVISHYLLSKYDQGLSLKEILPLARRIKEYLSKYKDGTWTLVEGGIPFVFDQELLNDLIEPLVEITLSITRKTILDADVVLEDISGVILVGGSTRIPYIRRRIQDYLRCAHFTAVDPDQVVAYGAALQAEALTKGSETLLLDITPLSLGVETMGGLVEKIIPRNTPIPARMTQEFTTYQDGQTAMKIHVVQGEREMVDHCRSLAQFSLKGIPPMTAGVARIEITFALDADGLLSVSAREKTTGIQQTIEVKPSYGLSEQEMRHILLSNAQHGQEDMQQRLLKEAKLEAEHLVASIAKAIQVDGDLLPQEELILLQDKMQQLTALLVSNDRAIIVDETSALSEMTVAFAEKRMSRALQCYTKSP